MAVTFWLNRDIASASRLLQDQVMGFLTTQVRHEFEGHQILVVHQESAGIKLYIDGEVKDTLPDETWNFSRRIAVLSGRIDINGKAYVVEVFRKGNFFTRLKICIDGVRVAGSLF
jgi:hypothetical protein